MLVHSNGNCDCDQPQSEEVKYSIGKRGKWARIYDILLIIVEVAVYMLKLYISSPRIEITIYIYRYIKGAVIKHCGDYIEICRVVCGPTGFGSRWRVIHYLKKIAMYVCSACGTRHINKTLAMYRALEFVQNYS